MTRSCQVYVGTSGWHYKHWLGDFYPPRFPSDRMFSWYARHFRTVELNNSFYRLPEERIFAHWKERAPAGFVFAVKASRFITHIKRLHHVEDAVDLFFSRAKPLREALGPVLFQLPPNWKANVERLAQFLAILPKAHRYAIEFRDDSWSTREVFHLLREHNVALCIHDWREMEWPIELTADFTYLRFHGSGQRYGGNYPDHVLRRWAGLLESWRSRLAHAFVYFNNDIGGHAVRNAFSLEEMLGGYPLVGSAKVGQPRTKILASA
ncbi:MAG: DUF72 domain-containing protein [Acidobacteria bacterium]|nr:DUF72 domain-containing protein [Acidobacteriota bacterium]